MQRVRKYSSRVEEVTLHILNLQPELLGEFFAGVELPGRRITKRVYKTFPSYIKAIRKEESGSLNLLVFLPDKKFNPKKMRNIRLAKLDSPLYIVSRQCSEKEYLTYLTLGISGILHPPFNPGDGQMVLNGGKKEEIPFPRNRELAREGQVRIDFLVPSKLSRILGINRLVSFLASEFDFPPEDSKVNLPLVMDEALSNAIQHGNKGREDLKVHVRIYISSSRIVIRVEDHGEGFIPDEKIDPTERENLYRKSGRGLYLIKEIMDSVSFKEGGRVVEIEKANRFQVE